METRPLSQTIEAGNNLQVILVEPTIAPVEMVTGVDTDEIVIYAEESSSEVGYEYPPDTYDACCETAKPFRCILYLAPLLDAATTTTSFVFDLIALNNTSLPNKVIPAIFEFLSTIGLTGETTKNNFDETCIIIKRRQLPRDWPPLSKCRERVAVCLSIFPGAWVLVSNGIQAYAFLVSMPESISGMKVHPTFWSVFSGVVASGTSITTFFTDSAEMYKTIREWLDPRPSPDEHIFIKTASITLGGTLGLLKSCQDSVQSYIAIKNLFNIHSLYGKILVGIPSIGHCLPDFCFTGFYSINAIKEFFKYLSLRKIEPTKIIAFSLVSSMAIYLALIRIEINKSAYKNITTDSGYNPNEVPEQVYDSLKMARFIQESIQTTACLYWPMYVITKKTGQGFKNMYHFFCPPPIPEDEIESQPLLEEQPSLFNKMCTFFCPPSISEDEVESPLLLEEQSSLIQFSD